MHPEHRLDPIAQDQIGEADDAVGDANEPVAPLPFWRGRGHNTPRLSWTLMLPPLGEAKPAPS